MSNAGKCLLWLTALTTASLALTGCNGSDEHPASAHVVSSAHRPVRKTPAPEPSTTSSPSPTPDPSTTPTPSTTPSPLADVVAPPTPVPLLVLSDGSDVVRIGGHPAHFPVTVTDATVSPNGLDLAFVDGAGNIATAHLDGTGLRVLTTTDPDVRRAQPTFEDGGGEIVFTERGHDGVWRLKEVAADGHDDLSSGKRDPNVDEVATDGGGDTSPSAAWYQASHTQIARSVLVFAHRTSRGQMVYLADRNQRGFGASRLLTGRAPAVSPTADRVAFIGADGQILVQSLEGNRPRPVQVTWGAHPTGHLAWSANGRRIYFSTARDVESVSSVVAHPGSNPEHVVLTHPGVAAATTRTSPTVGTFATTDPVSAAVAVSRARYADGASIAMDDLGGFGISWADHVTLVSTRDPGAAATASAIAAGGPLLFLRDGHLDAQVRDEIMRLLDRPRGMRRDVNVDIVGSSADVPDSVTSELHRLGLRVRRFAATDPAADAARVVTERHSVYVVVSADDLPGIVASASVVDDPVLLTDGSTMPTSTSDRLDRMIHDAGTPATVYAVGSAAQAAVRSSWAGERPFRIIDVGGSDDSDDSLAAVQELYDSPNRVSVTTSTDWRSLLLAGMVGPTLVVDPASGPSTAARDWLSASQAALRQVYVFGGTPALPATIAHDAYGAHYVLRGTPTDIPQ